MRENYERTLGFIMEHEGAKVHKVKGDKGGLTSAYGITLQTLVNLKLDLNKDGIVNEKDIYLVNKDVVDKVFREHYWNKVNGDSLPGGIDLIMADIAWNSGVIKAKQFSSEGYVKTVEQLTERRKGFYNYRAEMVLEQEKFLKGWLNRANAALEEAKKCVIWENPITDETMQKFMQ